MTKSDLKTGMVITLNSDDEYVVMRDAMNSEGKLVDIICNADTVIPLENYDDNLRCISACTPDGCLFGPLSDWWIDVVSVLPVPSPFADTKEQTVLWVRKYRG